MDNFVRGGHFEAHFGDRSAGNDSALLNALCTKSTYRNSEQDVIAYPGELCYTVPAALLQSGNREEVNGVEHLSNFLVAVAASVVAYYIRKWLDGHGKGK